MGDEPTGPFGIFATIIDRAGQHSSPFAGRKAQATTLVARLSAEEKRILAQIVGGWSSRDIAADHRMDSDAFAARRAEIFAKINAGSTSDAVRIGIYAGL